MIFDKKELKVLWPFYADSFIGTIFYLLVPFLMLYLIDIGLSFTNIGLLMAIWPLSSMIFEIPTGVIADRYGRKFSVITGWILCGLITLMVPISNNYIFLLIMFALLGASSSLISGAYDAWVVDLLKYKGMKNYYSHYFTKRQSLLNLALVLSGLIGAVVVKQWGLTSLWFFSGATLVLTSIFLSFGEERFNLKNRKIEHLGGAYRHAKDSFREILGNRKVSLLIFASFFMTIAIVLNNTVSWTPLLKMQGLQDYQFGYLWSLGSLIGVIAPFISQKMAKNGRERNTLILITFAFILIGILAIFSNILVMSIILAVVAISIMDFKRPVWLHYFHNQISSKKRATIGSMESLLGAFGGAMATVIMGLLIDNFGAKGAIVSSAFFGIIVLIIYFKIKSDKK